MCKSNHGKGRTFAYQLSVSVAICLFCFITPMVANEGLEKSRPIWTQSPKTDSLMFPLKDMKATLFLNYKFWVRAECTCTWVYWLKLHISAAQCISNNNVMSYRLTCPTRMTYCISWITNRGWRSWRRSRPRERLQCKRKQRPAISRECRQHFPDPSLIRYTPGESQDLHFRTWRTMYGALSVLCGTVSV